MQTLFAHSTAKKEKIYSKSSMICTQFISDVMNRAANLIELDKPNLLNVDMNVAMPRVIEHALKTEHVDDYTFLIKPLETNESFTNDVLEQIEKVSEQVAGKLHILNDHFNYECRYNGLNNDFDTARVLLFFAKETLSNNDYKKIGQYVKATYAIFDEDISNIELSLGKTAINSALNEAKTELSIVHIFAKAFKKWDLKQKYIENQKSNALTRHSSKLLDQKLLKLNSIVTEIKRHVDTKEIKSKLKRTDLKFTALTEFLNLFESLQEALSLLNMQAIRTLFNKVTDMQETVKKLSNTGKTKIMLNNAVIVLEEIKREFDYITSHELLQNENTVTVMMSLKG